MFAFQEVNTLFDQRSIEPHELKAVDGFFVVLDFIEVAFDLMQWFQINDIWRGVNGFEIQVDNSNK